MQRYIVCQNCRYFPNKLDQVNGQQVKRQANRIYWQCQVCYKINVYSNQQAVILPETQLIQINQKNLLKTKYVNIIIDLNNIKTSMCPYYTPLFKEKISKVCEIEEQNLKDMSSLQNQSQWFAKYISILKGLIKFIPQYNLFQQKSYASYLIFLIHEYVQSFVIKQHQRTVKTTVILLHKHEIYTFYICDVDSLTSFLKMYCLLQIEDKIPWLLNFYAQQLINCKKNTIFEDQIDTILLIGNLFEMEEQNIQNCLNIIELNIKIAQLIINNNLIILKSDSLQSNVNVFAINPYSKQAFLNYIRANSKRNKQQHSIISYCFHNLPKKQQLQQLIIIYFKSSKQMPTLTHTFKRSQIVGVKQKILSKPIPQEQPLKKICKTLIKDNSQIQLIKLYCEFYIANQKRIILYTFDWSKIERDLLFEELLDESQLSEYHQLKEDIVNQKTIKLNKPSPFMKKNAAYIKVQEKETNEEDYQYF